MPAKRVTTRAAFAALAAAAVSFALAVDVAPAAKKRPPLRDACKLVKSDEIKRLMGRRPVSKNGGIPQGCRWVTRRMVPGDYPVGRNAEEAGVGLSAYRSVAEAKEVAEAIASPGGCDPPEPLLPTRRRDFGNEAWLADCNSNVVFRLGRIVGEVSTYTNDVESGSRADTRRTAALTRIVVKRLRRYRCGRLCP